MDNTKFIDEKKHDQGKMLQDPSSKLPESCVSHLRCSMIYGDQANSVIGTDPNPREAEPN